MMKRLFEICEALPPGYRLDQLCGCGYWKRLLKGCVPEPVLDEQFCVRRFHCFLFQGAVGNGKHALAQALAGELVQAGYVYLRIPAALLIDEADKSAASDEEAAGAVRQLFVDAAAKLQGDAFAGVMLLFENAEELDGHPAVFRALAEGISMAEEGGCAMVVVVTVNVPFAGSLSGIPPYLEKQWIPCTIGLPDAAERKEFLENVFENRIPRSEKLKYKDMVDMTEGFNYENLSRLSVLAGMTMKQAAVEFYGRNPEQIAKALSEGILFMTKEMFENIVDHLRQEMIGIGRGGMQNSLSEPEGMAQNSVNDSNRINGMEMADAAAVPVEAEPEDFMSAFDDMDLDDL